MEPARLLCGISEARILEWTAIPFSRKSSQSKGLKLGLLCILHWQVDSLLLTLRGSLTCPQSTPTVKLFPLFCKSDILKEFLPPPLEAVVSVSALV